jgi:hypothetical protein
MSISGRAPKYRSRRADAGREYGDQGRGSCRIPGRTRRAKGCQRASSPDFGDHSMPRPAASCSFQRSTTALASARPVIASALGAGLDVEPPCPNPHDDLHSPWPAFFEASRRRTDGAAGRFSMSPTLCSNASKGRPAGRACAEDRRRPHRPILGSLHAVSCEQVEGVNPWRILAQQPDPNDPTNSHRIWAKIP